MKPPHEKFLRTPLVMAKKQNFGENLIFRFLPKFGFFGHNLPTTNTR